MSSNTPFAFDEFGVKISWRGIFPSSETIGEFYGLVILILLFWINSKKQKIKEFIDYIGILSASARSIFFRQQNSHCSCIFSINNLYLSIIF